MKKRESMKFWARSRVFVRTISLPLAVAAAAAASAAFLASGGRFGPALLAGSFGALCGIVSGSLALVSPEHRLAARWPRLSLAGWRPPRREVLELPVELYGAGEAALAHCGAARQLLGVRADTFRHQVAGLVGKGDAAYSRAREARDWLTSAAEQARDRGESEVPTGEAREAGAAPGLGRWVEASARARVAREAQVRRDLAAAREELASTTEMLGDLALRMSGLEGELGPAEHERRQILPHLAQLHEEMSALERAVALTPAGGLPMGSLPGSLEVNS